MLHTHVCDFTFKGDRIIFDVEKRLLLRNDPGDACGREENSRGRVQAIAIKDSRELIARHRSIFLLLSSACNLRCSYCFLDACDRVADGGLMPLETALRALDPVRNAKGTDGIFTVTVFGGEPLLNKTILPALLAELRQLENDKKLKITVILVTNLTLMDWQTAALLGRYDVTVEVSMDGPGEIHDRNRRYPDGRGSFEKVMQGLDILRTYVPAHRIWVRPTITRSVPVYDILSYLIDTGFRKISLGACTEAGTLNIPPGEFVDGLDSAMEKYVELLKNDYPVVISPLDMYLRKIYDFLGRNARDMYLDCGAGMDMIAVAPDGNIYPCPSFWAGAKKEEIILGNVRDGFDGRHPFLSGSQAVENLSLCKSCWGLPFCDGGCKMHAYRPSDAVACRVAQTHQPSLWQLCLYWYAFLRDEMPEVLRDIILPVNAAALQTFN